MESPTHDDEAPRLAGDVPGPKSRALAARLGAVESRNVTCLDPLPIFWERAAGTNVWDVDGNRFVDLTAAFGVAAVGHGHPDVVGAIASQSAALLHGMGDVHPAAVRVELLEALVARYPARADARAVVLSSGSDAVELALKTALLATGRAGVVAFEGGYHGLSLGALDATWRRDFRDPFAARLPGATVFAQFGDVADAVRKAEAASFPIGAVLVEPIQGRGGERVPPAGFLRELRQVCDERGWLLVADEIYTGFGRTGRWFACDHEEVVPDLLCVGKGLASGMPISACLGRTEVMDAWPASGGEALHTQTFLGHPASCAAALASLRVIERDALVARSARLGDVALARLRDGLVHSRAVRDVRGRGLMLGVECASPGVSLPGARAALRQGIIVLPSGEDGRVLSITPPLSISDETLALALDRLIEAILAVADADPA